VNAPSGALLHGYPPADLQAAGGLATAREIAQQPALWRGLPPLVAASRVALASLVAPRPDRTELRLLLTGAGSSAFAGELLAPSLARALRRRVDAVATTDLVSNPADFLAEDVPTLLVSLARSGDSPESVAATRLADAHLTDCRHLVVTCNADGALARRHRDDARSLVLAMPPASHDAGFAMTSSFTCMALSVLLALAPPLLPGPAVERLAAAAEHLLRRGGDVGRAVAGRRHERVVHLGSGPLKGLARESALKLLELTAGRVATWFDSPLGFRHGPKAVVDGRTLVVVHLSADPYTRQYDEDIVTELRASMPAGSVLTVTPGDIGTGPGGPPADPLADLDDATRGIVMVVFAQLLALHLSLAHGLTPDNPFPSGEVNRVVAGVTIHPQTP